MTQNIGVDQARIVGDTHEDVGRSQGQPDREEQMDRKNNEVGRRCGLQLDSKTCAERCMDKHILGALYGWAERGGQIVCRGFSCYLIVLLMAGCMDQRSPPAETFDVATWANTPEENRYALALDLVNRKLLQGKNLVDVIAMLGPPSSRNDADHYLTYIVRTGGKGFDQVEMLEIQLASPGDTVERAIIRGD